MAEKCLRLPHSVLDGRLAAIMKLDSLCNAAWKTDNHAVRIRHGHLGVWGYYGFVVSATRNSILRAASTSSRLNGGTHGSSGATGGLPASVMNDSQGTTRRLGLG